MNVHYLYNLHFLEPNRVAQERKDSLLVTNYISLLSYIINKLFYLRFMKCSELDYEIIDNHF